MSTLETKINSHDLILKELERLKEEQKILSILLKACSGKNQTKENCDQYSQCEWFPGGEEYKKTLARICLLEKVN